MGGEIQWQSLEAIVEYLEIKDIDLLIDSLILFKTYQDSQSKK